VDLLLALPEIIGPGIFEGLVDARGFEEGHGWLILGNERTEVEQKASGGKGRGALSPPFLCAGV
jgi:hypothetical protein